MVDLLTDVQRIYNRAENLIILGRELQHNFSYQGLFALVQEVASAVENEYEETVKAGAIKKEVVIATVLDLYDKNKWDFSPKVPNFIEKRLLKFVLNRSIDYIVDVLNKYVWKKQ